jgi:hypothetical protein
MREDKQNGKKDRTTELGILYYKLTREAFDSLKKDPSQNILSLFENIAASY